MTEAKLADEPMTQDAGAPHGPAAGAAHGPGAGAPPGWRELGQFIRDQRAVAHLSLRRLSGLAGVSNPYLSQIERGLRRPSAEILQQIAKALRISAETLYVRAGILEAREVEGGDLESAIMAEPSLTEDQRLALVRVYRSFSKEDGEP